MIKDEFGGLPAVQRVEQFRGRVMSVRTDDVDFGDQVHARDYIVHFGAVAVVAMNDDDQVLVIQQYRHPVAAKTWEIPAGLLDMPDEDPLTAVQRELAEEAGYLARDWYVLTEYATTPGGSTEVIRIYLARGLNALPERPKTDEAEEQDMPVAFVGLDELRDAILGGLIANTSLVVGGLAALAARSVNWSSLQPPDAPWPMREHLARNDRIFRP